MRARAAPPALLARIAQQCAGEPPAAGAAIVAALRERYGQALQGVLFYGSCCRNRSFENGIADIYAVVDDYRRVYDKRGPAYLNGWLPPNVFYCEINAGTDLIRVKLALISMADLTRGIRQWFHSYLWGRFAQPVRILYACSEARRRQLHALFAQAVLTLLKSSIPTLPEKRNDAEAIWSRALSLSYSAEYRSERKSMARDLFRAAPADYSRLLEAALPGLQGIVRRDEDGCYLRLSDQETSRRFLRRWRWRRWQGRILWILRLMKAALTFKNGVDYAAWKLNRHTGIELEVTPRLRRYPLLFGWWALAQLLWRGVLR